MSRMLLAESQKKRFEWMNFIDFGPFHNELQGLWCLEEVGEGETCLEKPKKKKYNQPSKAVLYAHVRLFCL